MKPIIYVARTDADLVLSAQDSELVLQQDGALGLLFQKSTKQLRRIDAFLTETVTAKELALLQVGAKVLHIHLLTHQPTQSMLTSQSTGVARTDVPQVQTVTERELALLPVGAKVHQLC